MPAKRLISLELQRQTLLRNAEGMACWDTTTTTRQIDPTHVALLICDMWDKHWSKGAMLREKELVPRMNDTIMAARKKGITIIHAPSETLDFYENHPARLRMDAIPLVDLPVALPRQYPPLPIDDSDGGSDTNEARSETPNQAVWTRQHPGIEIDDERDYISDFGSEICALFKQKGITTMLIAGVHTNMCVLNRSFAIKQMLEWGFDVVLVRDLTDAMYNPAMPPYVSHDEGTRLVIGYIEKFLCPTTTSDCLA